MPTRHRRDSWPRTFLAAAAGMAGVILLGYLLIHGAVALATR